jgi:valyl-tRNA synthetase
MQLGLYFRSHDIMESMIKPKWFANYQGMAKQALEMDWD